MHIEKVERDQYAERASKILAELYALAEKYEAHPAEIAAIAAQFTYEFVVLETAGEPVEC